MLKQVKLTQLYFYFDDAKNKMDIIILMINMVFLCQPCFANLISHLDEFTYTHTNSSIVTGFVPEGTKLWISYRYCLSDSSS